MSGKKASIAMSVVASAVASICAWYIHAGLSSGEARTFGHGRLGTVVYAESSVLFSISLGFALALLLLSLWVSFQAVSRSRPKRNPSVGHH